jgi:hypothetical protein
MMAWMQWGKGALRLGPDVGWKGWAGDIQVRSFADADVDMLLLDNVLLGPRAILTVVGEGREPDATVAFEFRPLPRHDPACRYLHTQLVNAEGLT